MTAQEQKEYEMRKKIASTLLHANEIMEGHGFVFCLKLADALIAEGIGDVIEWKHRAEVAEKAFDLINKENPSCFVPYSCRGLDCIECAKKYFYEQAEKELQEERKDE